MNKSILWLFASVMLLSVTPVMAGGTNGGDPNGNAPGDSSDGCGCGSSKGMPVYSFKSMLASLNIRDTPLSYAPPVGPKMDATITYNEREADQPATFDSFNLGQKWTLNWLTWIQDNPTSPGSQVLRFVAGGGGESYSGYNSSTGAFTPERDNAAVLVETSSNPITYELRFASGGKDVFAESDGKTSYPRKVFLTQIVDPQGNTVTLHYDSQLRLTTVTDAIGQATTLQYNDANNSLLVTGITDPFGRSTIIAYDSAGRLDSITDEIGMTSTFTYDSSTFVTSMTTPYGTTTFAHTEGASGDPTELSIEATDPLGQTERTEYHVAAPSIPFSVSQVPTGLNTFNAYLNYRDSYYWDKDAFAAACTGSGSSTSCDYTKARLKHFLHKYPCCQLTSRYLENVKYPLEGMIWYDYVGQQTAYYPGVIDKPSHVGRVLSNGTTQLTSYVYNAYGKVTKKTDADGRQTDYTYAPNGIDLIEVQQKDGANLDTIAQYTYNSQHEPLTVTNASGETTAYTYNAQGQRTSKTDALGNTTTYVYDSNGYLTSIINPLGRVQHSFTYDGFGRVASDTDSQGYTRSYTYDALNRITAISYPDNTTRSFVWNRLDVASVTDRQGNTTTYTYDANRNLIQSTDPLGFATKYTYYPNGKLQTLTDPNGNVTTWTRDLEGRIVAKSYADGKGNVYAYDNSSRLVSATDALGQTKLYAYDPTDLLTGIQYQNAVNPTAAVSYAYDAAYPRLVSMTDGIGTTTLSYGPAGLDGALKLTSVVGPYSGNDTVAYHYDALGRIIERDTDQKDQFNYDALGRVNAESNFLGSFAYSYLGDTGQVTQQALTTPTNAAGYTVDVDYDGNTGDRQLQSLTYQGPLALLATESLGFTHSPEHQLLSRSEFSIALLQTHVNNYSYDNDYRLTQATLDLLLPADQYQYDAADNLLKSQLNTGTSITASANNLNQLAAVNGTARQYDADGNLINDGTYQYTWDAENRLISVTNLTSGHITSFKYDGLGQRLAIDEQDVGGAIAETRYLWCNGQICQARDGNDNVTADYFSQGEVKGGQGLYYIKDQIGSVIGVMDASSALLGTDEYSAYGVTKLATGTQSDFRYAGMLYNPATGLYLTQYRAYRPEIGRWLNRDPIGERGGNNIYAYVNDKPTLGADDIGLLTLVLGGGATAAGPTGAEASGGLAISTGNLSTGEAASLGVFGAGGVTAGVNVSADAFVGIVSGGLSDLGGTTINQNITIGPISITIIQDPSTGNVVGGTIGIGPGVLPVEYSGAVDETVVQKILSADPCADLYSDPAI